MELQQYTQELAALLQNSLSADNALIKQSTTALKSYYSKAACVPALINIASAHPTSHIRQIAAVECVKRVKKHFLTLDDATRNELKTKLLQVILVETNPRSRQSLARVISAVAELLLPIHQWPELKPFLYQSCSSNVAAHRETGVQVLHIVFDTIADADPDNFDTMLKDLFNLFRSTISDPESYAVRITTLQCLGKVAIYIENDDKTFVSAFQGLIPAMVAVLQEALQKQDEDAAAKGFEVFDELQILEAPVLSKHIGDLTHFSLGVASATELSSTLRVMALNFLIFFVEVKRTRLQKLKLIEKIIQTLFTIGCEEEPEDEEEDSPPKVAFQVLNSLAVNIPPQQVFTPLMNIVSGHYQNANEGVRKACMLSIAVVVDGCADYMRPRIDSVAPIVFAGLQDPAAIVKKAACMTLCCLSEDLDAEVNQYHSTILPLLFQLMNDGTAIPILTHATNALDSIMESMEESELLPYLPSLMEKLVYLLNVPKTEFKATVVGAIGSAAHSAGEKFMPYFPQTISAMKVVLDSCQTEEEMLLKGVAFDTVSAIAEAVGKEPFRPFMQEFMQMAMVSLNHKNSRLHECCFCFFGGMARVFENEFSPYLPHIVPGVIQSCLQEELDYGEQVHEQGFGDEDAVDQRVRVNSSIAEEKETAADTLGTLFASTTSDFLPFVEDATNVLIKTLLNHQNDGVRVRSRGALFMFLHTFYKMSHPAEWKAGLPVQVPVHENVVAMLELILGAVLPSMEDEYDKYCVSQALLDFAEALKTLGPIVIAKQEHKEFLLKQVMSIFRKEHTCQEEIIDEDEADEESSSSSSTQDDVDQSEHEAMLMSAAADVMSSLAIVLGGQFLEAYQHFHPFICKYLTPTKSVTEKSFALGTMAEVTQGLGEAVLPLTEEFFKAFSAGLNDPMDEIRSNAAFGMGLLVENTPLDLSSHFMQILQSLRPLFNVSETTLSNVRDNACGAVCRMMMKRPDAVPLEAVVPVVLGVLPLKKDFDENEPIYMCLVKLLQSHPALFDMTRMLQLFAHVLPQQLNTKTKSVVVEYLKQAQTAASFQEAARNLSPEQLEVIVKAIQ